MKSQRLKKKKKLNMLLFCELSHIFFSLCGVFCAFSSEALTLLTSPMCPRLRDLDASHISEC